MTTSLKLINIQDNINEVDITNPSVDIITNQVKFDTIKYIIGQIYSIYAKYIYTGALDDILAETTKSILTYIGTQSNLYDDNTPYTFSYTTSPTVQDVSRDNDFLRYNIQQQNIIRNNYIDISSKQTYNRYSTVQSKPEALQYFYCNWNVVYGDITKLNKLPDPIINFVNTPDAFQFPITILQILPLQHQEYSDILINPYFKYNFTTKFNNGLILSFYLKMMSSQQSANISGMTLSIINLDKNIIVYKQFLQFIQYSHHLSKHRIKIPTYVLRTNDSSANDYHMQLIFQFKSTNIITYITAIQCLSKQSLEYDAINAAQFKTIIDYSVQEQR